MLDVPREQCTQKISDFQNDFAIKLAKPRATKFGKILAKTSLQ